MRQDASPSPVAGATKVVEVTSQLEIEHTRQLMRAFVKWHRGRHPADLDLIDAYFDNDAFEAELATLPGPFARPAGRLLLALRGGEPAGCVAMKPLDQVSCEMKRMFVEPRFQGLGIGRDLARTLLKAATDEGYQSMLLDTSIRQTEAMSLYRSLGFETTDPYYDCPPDMAGWLVFMKKDLGVRPPDGAH